MEVNSPFVREILMMDVSVFNALASMGLFVVEGLTIVSLFFHFSVVSVKRKMCVASGWYLS